MATPKVLVESYGDAFAKKDFDRVRSYCTTQAFLSGDRLKHSTRQTILWPWWGGLVQ